MASIDVILKPATSENVSAVVCAIRRLKSACVSVQSDHCLQEETLQSWLSKMRPVKILISLNLYWALMSEGTFSDITTHKIKFLASIGLNTNFITINIVIVVDISMKNRN